MAHILIVDDDPTVIRFYTMALEGQGYQVKSASNGFGAVVLLESEEFDLVITDYDMPGMKGDELSVKIKDKRPSLPIIMATGSQFPTTDKINYFLEKPIKIHLLFAVVKSLIKKQ